MDNSNKENLDKLEKVENTLLGLYISQVHSEIGLYEQHKEKGKNSEALIVFVKRLLDERKLHQAHPSP